MKRIHQVKVHPAILLASVMGGLLFAIAGAGTTHAQCEPLTPCPGSSLPIKFETYPSLRTGWPATPAKNLDKVKDQYLTQGVQFLPASSSAWLEIFTPAAGTQSTSHAVTLVQYGGGTAGKSYGTWIKGTCATTQKLGRTPSIQAKFVSNVFRDVPAPRTSVSVYTGLAFVPSLKLKAWLVAHTTSGDLLRWGNLYGAAPYKSGIRNLLTVTSTTKNILSAELYFEQATCSSTSTLVPLPAIDDLSWK